MGYPHPIHSRETPVLSKHFGEKEALTLDGWKKRGGYKAMEKALGSAQQQGQWLAGQIAGLPSWGG